MRRWWYATMYPDRCAAVRRLLFCRTLEPEYRERRARWQERHELWLERHREEIRASARLGY